jgi:deoxyribonuclease-4
VQIFLGDPQGWKKPPPREDAAALKASDTVIYVHAPYSVSVASANNRIRLPSRTIRQQTVDAAEEVGAAGVIVHGGHIPKDESAEEGFLRWAKAMDQLDMKVPVLLENTAGGDHAMARHFDTIAGLWDHIGDSGIGFCLDTCHAHAAGEELISSAERILSITGRIDLVHCNDSKDGSGSGRDRHEHLGQGQVEPEALVETVRVAGAPVICETGDDHRKDDLTWLRERL